MVRLKAAIGAGVTIGNRSNKVFSGSPSGIGVTTGEENGPEQGPSYDGEIKPLCTPSDKALPLCCFYRSFFVHALPA